MKRIYFVRHGESEANVSDNHSGPLTPLTPRGHEQAAFIAERCSRLHLDTLITSTYVRAMQTAKYIAEKTGLNPIESDLFVENRFVSASFGKPRSTPELIEAMQKIVDHWGAPGYHAADEENSWRAQTRLSPFYPNKRKKELESLRTATS
jgi:broad specificity phosphatase PhoE